MSAADKFTLAVKEAIRLGNKSDPIDYRSALIAIGRAAVELHEANNAQPAQKPTDERAAFEAWIAKDCGDLSKFGTGQNTHYKNSAVNNAWIGWKARAGIATYEAEKAQPAPELTREQVDKIWDALTPSGVGRSRYDVARDLIAAGRADTAVYKSIAFKLVENELPLATEYSSSYGGQWSSRWCVVWSESGDAAVTRLILRASQKEAQDRGELRLYPLWLLPLSTARIVAWAYMDDVGTAIRAAMLAARAEEGGT